MLSESGTNVEIPAKVEGADLGACNGDGDEYKETFDSLGNPAVAFCENGIYDTSYDALLRCKDPGFLPRTNVDVTEDKKTVTVFCMHKDDPFFYSFAIFSYRNGKHLNNTTNLIYKLPCYVDYPHFVSLIDHDGVRRVGSVGCHTEGRTGRVTNLSGLLFPVPLPGDGFHPSFSEDHAIMNFIDDNGLIFLSPDRTWSTSNIDISLCHESKIGLIELGSTGNGDIFPLKCLAGDRGLRWNSVGHCDLNIDMGSHRFFFRPFVSADKTFYNCIDQFGAVLLNGSLSRTTCSAMDQNKYILAVDDSGDDFERVVARCNCYGHGCVYERQESVSCQGLVPLIGPNQLTVSCPEA